MLASVSAELSPTSEKCSPSRARSPAAPGSADGTGARRRAASRADRARPGRRPPSGSSGRLSRCTASSGLARSSACRRSPRVSSPSAKATSGGSPPRRAPEELGGDDGVLVFPEGVLQFLPSLDLVLVHRRRAPARPAPAHSGGVSPPSERSAAGRRLGIVARRCRFADAFEPLAELRVGLLHLLPGAFGRRAAPLPSNGGLTEPPPIAAYSRAARSTGDQASEIACQAESSRVRSRRRGTLRHGHARLAGHRPCRSVRRAPAGRARRRAAAPPIAARRRTPWRLSAS